MQCCHAGKYYKNIFSDICNKVGNLDTDQESNNPC